MDVLPSALATLGVPGFDDLLGLRLDGVRRIAVLLIDGLGWHQIPTAAPFAPTLADLAARAPRMITTGFPSTTPTSLVSLGTGVSPGTHGVLGFRVAIPGTDTVLTHTHWRHDPDPAVWQPVPTLFERAAAAGLTVAVANRPEFTHSGLTMAAACWPASARRARRRRCPTATFRTWTATAMSSASTRSPGARPPWRSTTCSTGCSTACPPTPRCW
jgi:hypothetical protein